MPLAFRIAGPDCKLLHTTAWIQSQGGRHELADVVDCSKHGTTRFPCA